MMTLRLQKWAMISGIFMLACSSVQAAEYLVNAAKGNDENAGTEAMPWACVRNLNEKKFKGGDVIKFHRGQNFFGQINMRSSGKEGAPIVISSYGEGKKPTINGQGKVQTTVLMRNISHIILENLCITNKGAAPKAKRYGIELQAMNAGIVKGITLRGLTVRDVNGVFSKEEGRGAEIYYWAQSNRIPSKFDNLLIENCYLSNCDRDGIKGGLRPWMDLTNLSTNVVIRNNMIEDVGGDAIVLIGTKGGLVEGNRVYGARRRFNTADHDTIMHAGASVGIWPWSSKDSVIRFNEVWGYKGTFDGQGLDSDYNCTNTHFEYNFSGDNEGGFFLICSDFEHEKRGNSIGNTNSTLHYNISFNDHTRTFLINGPLRNIEVKGNIIYNVVDENLVGVVDATPNAAVNKNVIFSQNRFYTKAPFKAYRGYWKANGCGTFAQKAPMNYKQIQFSNNQFSKVSRHKEPGMKM